VVDKLTKSCPAVVALTSSGAMYSIVPQNENARYVCTYQDQQLKSCEHELSKCIYRVLAADNVFAFYEASSIV